PRIGVKSEGVIDGRKHIGATQEGEAYAEFRQNLIVIPQREGVVRDLGDLRSRARRRSSTGNECVLPGVAAHNIPSTCDASVPSQLEAICALTSGLHDPRGIVGVRRACVRAIETIYGGGEGQATPHIPLNAGLVNGEFLRLHLLSDGGQR